MRVTSSASALDRGRSLSGPKSNPLAAVLQTATAKVDLSVVVVVVVDGNDEKDNNNDNGNDHDNENDNHAIMPLQRCTLAIGRRCTSSGDPEAAALPKLPHLVVEKDMFFV